jgi:hypothetical protein
MRDFDPPETYAFGPREGEHLNLLCNLLVGFAESQDLALTDLLGYIEIAKATLIKHHVVAKALEDDANEFPHEGP